MGLQRPFRRFSALFIGLVEMLFFSGIHYGFNALIPVWQDMQVFFHLCPNITTTVKPGNESSLNESYGVVLPMDAMKTTSTPQLPTICLLANNYYSYAFIIWTVFHCVVTVPVGFIFDKWGLRFSKCLGAICFLVGTVCYGVTSAGHPGFLFPSGCFVAAASQFLIMSNIQIGQFFPRAQNMVITLYSGAFDSSSVVFFFIQKAYAAGISMLTSFLVLGISGAIITSITACTLLTTQQTDMAKYASKVKVEKTSTEAIEADVAQTDKIAIIEVPRTATENGTEDIPEETAELNPDSQLLNTDEKYMGADVEEVACVVHHNNWSTQLDERYPSLKSCLLSRYFIFHMIYFSAVLLRFSFFLTGLSQLLAHIFFGDKAAQIRVISNVGLFLFFGVFVAPLSGIMIDFLRANSGRSKAKEILNTDRNYWINIRPVAVPMLVCSFAATLLSCLVFVSSEYCMYFVFFLLTICRGFLFSTNSAGLLCAFPLRYFGKVFGLNFFIGGIASCLQYALIELGMISLPAVNTFLIGLSLLSFVHPVQILVGASC